MEESHVSVSSTPGWDYKKIGIATGLFASIAALIIGIFVIQVPRDDRARAQDTSPICPTGQFVTSPTACSQDGGTVIGGDSTSTLICCQPRVVNTPLQCPENSVVLPAEQCPPERRIDPTNISDIGDISLLTEVCCRPELTPVEILTPPSDEVTPPDDSCIDSTVTLLDINVTCPTCDPQL